MADLILSNAHIVLPDRELDGSVVVENGRISDISPRKYAAGLDLHGVLLVPGVIDVHTDYLEREISPRPSAQFPVEMALHVMDLRALGCGLTTVLSAARISEEKEGTVGSWHGDGLELARQYESLAPQMRARHLIHVRWDTNFPSADGALKELLQLKSIGNLVYNDSTPGERQYRRDIETIIQRRAERQGVSLAEARAEIEARRDRAKQTNNRHQVRAALGGRLPIGSHDDTTLEHVVEAHEAGATLCEMPCTIEAARKARELGMMICMGAPNYFRGGSHCGNLSCHDALAENLVDILCSDYHFPSLLAAAIRMMRSGIPISQAMSYLALNPARHLGKEKELGSIEVGKRADLVAFHPRQDHADVVRVWVDGDLRFSVLDSALN